MTRIHVRFLKWDRWNTEHIKKHDLTSEEVEEAVENVTSHRAGYKGRFILIGRSGSRIIAVIMKKEKAGEYYVITARDADRRERMLVYEKEK